jgi:hypothetical protein
MRCHRANVPGGQAAAHGSAAWNPWVLARWCLLPPKHVQQGVSAKEDSFKMRIPAALAACMGSQLVNHRYGMGAPHPGHPQCCR